MPRRTQDDVALRPDENTDGAAAFVQSFTLNDDFTPMEFVVQSFATHLPDGSGTSNPSHAHRPHRRARRLWVYTKDIAATKVDQVLDMAGFTSTLAVRNGGKRMIAQELEASLHMAFMDARQNAMSSSALNTCCWPCSTTLCRRCCGPAAPTWISCARTCPNSSNSTHAAGIGHR